MSSETIIYNAENSIATILINRPEKMNAFRLEEFDQLIGGIILADNDPDIKVIKIRSAGNRAFSGGLDLGMVQELPGSPDKISELLKTGENVVKTFYKSKKPIVIEVQGPAVGWGTILCLIADFVIAGDNPKTFFILNEIDIGLFPGTGALTTALMNVGLKQAKRMLMIPEKIFLDHAEKIDLVTKRVTTEQLETETEKFCQNLANKDPNILLLIKGTLNYLHMNELEYFFTKEREGFKLFQKGEFQSILEHFENLWDKAE